MLVIEVEFLTGVSVAASPYRREEPEWPPHPDRLFQALVAAWGRHDSPDEVEKWALKWLEALDRNSLEVFAPAAHPRTVATVFVPPNDARTTGRIGSRPPKKLDEAAHVVPELRKNRQQRTFPAVIVNPEVNAVDGENGNSRAVVYYIWSDSPGIESHHEALERLVREVTYLGHPHTLVRVALVTEVNANPTDGLSWVRSNGISLRCPHKGRLEHLESQYKRSMKSAVAVRPNPSLVTKEFRPSREAMPPTTLFDGENFITFEDTGGFCPSLSAFPFVAKRLRDALLKIADDKGIPIPTLLSGHNSDKRPTTEAHLSIVPLADVGWEYSQGRLMGLAIVLPRNIDDGDRRNVGKMLAEFVRDSKNKGSAGMLHFGRNGSWLLSLSPEPTWASLRFKGRYVRAAQRWGTVLPVVLDRHPKDKPNQDILAIIVNACRNVGLEFEAIKDLKVEVHQYAAIRGAPSVQEVARTLPKDSPYRSRPLVHVVLDFPRPVLGPLILGAGRFRGLGLCLPLE